MEGLDWLNDIGEQPNLPKQLRKTFDDEYEDEYKKASVDTKSMTGFFKSKVRELIDKYKKLGQK